MMTTSEAMAELQKELDRLKESAKPAAIKDLIDRLRFRADQAGLREGGIHEYRQEGEQQ